VPVPGLFDSDIEAAVARDEFLIRCQLSPPTPHPSCSSATISSKLLAGSAK
jgi:hypothetical protein